MERLLHPAPRYPLEILFLLNIPVMYILITSFASIVDYLLVIPVINAFITASVVFSFRIGGKKTTQLTIQNEKTKKQVKIYVKEIAVIGIPVEGNGNKYVRGFKTNDDKTYLLPTKDIELFISSKDGKEIVMVEESGSDEGIHRRWLEDVFPPDIYESPEKLSKLDANLVLLRPSKPMNKT